MDRRERELIEKMEKEKGLSESEYAELIAMLHPEDEHEQTV